MIANISGVWNTKENEFSIGKYTIDIDEFKERSNGKLARSNLIYHYYLRLGFLVYRSRMRSFVMDRRSFFEEIFSYLDIPYQTPPSSDYQIILKDLP